MSQLTFFDDICLKESDELIFNGQYDYWSLAQPTSQNEIKFTSIFNIEECEKIIKLGKRLNMSSSSVGDKSQSDTINSIRSSNNSWIPINQYTDWIYQRIDKAVKGMNDKFFEFDLVSIENLQFTEYHSNKSGHYSKHIDMHHNCLHPNLYRKLSFSIQLSDPQTYEGGNLLVYFSKEPSNANREIGSGSFFPSYALHEVTPTTKGVRYSLVGWATGPRLK
jgi:PKHD-type hydroxylase